MSIERRRRPAPGPSTASRPLSFETLLLVHGKAAAQRLTFFSQANLRCRTLELRDLRHHIRHFI